MATHGGAAKPPVAPVTPTKKTVDVLAKEVIDGKWGVGADQKNRLTAAGYDYSAVQKKVNELTNSKPAALKSVDAIAKEVIAGKWGNNPERKKKLTAAGYDYNAIQKRVNAMIK